MHSCLLILWRFNILKRIVSVIPKVILLLSVIVMPLVATAAIPNTQAVTPGNQTILIFGDSLSAAYGLQENLGWVALLQARLTQQKLAYTVVNSSISGETTSGGLNRYSQVIAMKRPGIVVLELGANDGLRGLKVSEMRANLITMIRQTKTAKIVLVGMKIPPNYGLKYSREFSASYALIAKQYNLSLVPFLLEGIAGKPSLIQDDGLHPTADAQTPLLDNVWRVLEPLLKK